MNPQREVNNTLVTMFTFQSLCKTGRAEVGNKDTFVWFGVHFLMFPMLVGEGNGAKTSPSVDVAPGLPQRHKKLLSLIHLLI